MCRWSKGTAISSSWAGNMRGWYPRDASKGETPVAVLIKVLWAYSTYGSDRFQENRFWAVSQRRAAPKSWLAHSACQLDWGWCPEERLTVDPSARRPSTSGTQTEDPCQKRHPPGYYGGGSRAALTALSASEGNFGTGPWRACRLYARRWCYPLTGVDLSLLQSQLYHQQLPVAHVIVPLSRWREAGVETAVLRVLGEHSTHA